MNNYKEGDLIRATKGEYSIQGRLTKDGDDDYIISADGTDYGSAFTYLFALTDEDFTIEVIESAKVSLPDEIGSIVRFSRHDNDKTGAAVRTGISGWMRTDSNSDKKTYFNNQEIQELPDLEVVFVPGK